MNISFTELPRLMAIQHRVLKDLKKKSGLRQRDWEVLCACQRLSLASYPFTANKINTYLMGAYFLPCLYDSINVLVSKGYLTVVIPGKPFMPELYDISYPGKALVRKLMDEMRHLSERTEIDLIGLVGNRVW